MFEYLMPPLLLGSYPGTLLYQTAEAAIDQQIVARVQELAWFAPVTYTPVYVFGAPELGGIEMNERNRLQNPVEIFSTEC